MKIFACRSMGNDCTWKHTARTDDLLIDIVAMHLRQVHGLDRMTPEEIGAVRKLIAEPAPGLDMEAETAELKEFRCADIGQRCDWHYIAQTEDLIADGVAVHAREAHGIKEFTPQLIADVKKSIHAWHA